MRRSGRLRNHQTNCQGPPYSTRCECTSPSVPVKRHRGEPGHTGHTGGKRHRGEKWGSRDKPRRHGCQVKSSQVKSSRRPRGRRARLRPPCSLTALVEQAPRALVELPCARVPVCARAGARVCPVCVPCVRNHRHTFTFTKALHTPRRVQHGGGLNGRQAHGGLTPGVTPPPPVSFYRKSAAGSGRLRACGCSCGC